MLLQYIYIYANLYIYIIYESLTNHIPNYRLLFLPGPRVCAGENLAKMELFIFAVHLLQRLKFDVETDGVMPTQRGIEKATHVPQAYNVRISPCLV